MSLEVNSDYLKGDEDIMNESRSCKEAMSSCIDTGRFAFTHLYNDEKAMNMHIHDCYEVYFAISGGRQFLIDENFYEIENGDMFFINQYESHYLSQVDRAIHERIVLAIHPDYLKQLSSQATDLDYCFQGHNKGKGNRIHLSEDEQKRFVYFIHKLRKNEGFGGSWVVCRS